MTFAIGIIKPLLKLASCAAGDVFRAAQRPFGGLSMCGTVSLGIATLPKIYSLNALSAGAGGRTLGGMRAGRGASAAGEDSHG